jgi:hypothetical protein
VRERMSARTSDGAQAGAPANAANQRSLSTMSALSSAVTIILSTPAEI